MSPGSERGRRQRRQRGVALLITLLLLVLGAAAFLLGQFTDAGDRARRSGESATLLAQARDAVIAYAAYGGTNNKPGALPCPDMNAPGEAASGKSNSLSCINTSDSVYLHRLPWRTIDLAQQFGDRVPEIWYAIDGHFKDDPTIPPALNPDTSADLRLAGKRYAAVILLAGPPRANQTHRPSATVADYLEDENADGDNMFRDCGDTNDCNDRAIGISREALLAGVRKRALGRVRAALRTFHDANGYYPWAALDGEGGECTAGTQSGQPAIRDADGDCNDHTLKAASDGGDLPDWLVDNEWYRFLDYQLPTGCGGPPGGGACTSGPDAIVQPAGAIP